jgi:hypothetical protein
MKDKKQIVSENLINQMFSIAGHQVVFEDIKDRKDDWYYQWTMTKEQNEEWLKWGTAYIKKELKTTKKMASMTMRMFDLSYGLKVSEPDTNAK